MPAEQLAQIFEVLEGGAQVAGEVVQFPVDAAGAAAETSLAGEGISTLVQMGNGAAAEVSQLTVVEGGAATTTGVGLLAMDVGVAGAAIAPALGILAGVGLYNLAPEFWTNVSNSLVAAGQTVGGKVRAFLNGNTKQAYLSEETIEIFKNAFIEAGLFDAQLEGETYSQPQTIQLSNNLIDISQFIQSEMKKMFANSSAPHFSPNWQFQIDYITNKAVQGGYNVALIRHSHGSNSYNVVLMNATTATLTQVGNALRIKINNNYTGLTYMAAPYSNMTPATNPVTNWMDLIDNSTIHFRCSNPGADYSTEDYSVNIGTAITNTQEGATLPSNSSPISETYPGWHTHSEDCPCNPELKIYPIEIPANNPDPNQGQAQNPDPDPDPGPWLDWLTDNLPQPDPNPDPSPEPGPQPRPDPDPQPDPDPIPSGGTDPVPPDPPDPNPVPPTPPIPVVPVVPATVDSNAMFTVYSPSLSQLNSFGGWLWNSSIIEQILRMWQNPLDGIIAFMKVYAVPTTGSNANIQVGYLDSGVSAPVVTSQFATVDCGTVQVNESKHNATDYTPYVSLHLYLPFIGIVELDPDEFMDGSISVKYTIDVYTGTCLAEVKCTRSIDMPNATILYTFSGNASQQLPLTSANFAGALSSLVSAVGGGIMIASGGAVGGIAGAAALGHSLTHEMVHVGHSGALSSNAGIMASRKPYLIISRRHGYDANNYADEYGYPANKAVYLGNCSGFTRVKAGHLKCKADSIEKEEIMALLEKGVIL